MFIFSVPVTLKIITALVSILLVNKFTKNLQLSVITAIVILVLWIQLPFIQVYKIIFNKLTSVNTIMLLIVIYEITILSNLMSETGMMKKLVNAVNSIVSPVYGMAVLPAIIGLLPIPGGAIFSAPLVDDCDENNEIDAILKTKINYWFRHVWEFWWPLYPGVLLAVDLTGLGTFTYSAVLSPLTLFTIAGGYFFLLRKVKITHGKKSSALNMFELWRNIFYQLYPIIIIILLFAFFNIIFPELAEISNYLPMLIAVFISLAAIIILAKPDAAMLKRNLFSRKIFNLIYLVAVILLYGAVIECTLPNGSLLMDQVRLEISSAGIAPLFIIALLPFISGLSTGISVALVGASFPIVIGVIPQNISEMQFAAYIVLAAGCGYIGMILSPVHICLIVTNNYFKSNLTQSIIRLLKPVLFIVAGIAILFCLYYFI